jgi:hypothetical protein
MVVKDKKEEPKLYLVNVQVSDASDRRYKGPHVKQFSQRMSQSKVDELVGRYTRKYGVPFDIAPLHSKKVEYEFYCKLPTGHVAATLIIEPVGNVAPVPKKVEEEKPEVLDPKLQALVDKGVIRKVS